MIDAGLGFDTLALDGSNMVLDFASISAGSKVKSIEAIDLTGAGNNTLKLSFDDVFVLNDNKELRIEGNAGDRVELTPPLGSNNPISSSLPQEVINDKTFDVYEYNAENEYGKILVEHAVTVII